ncbi:MAG: aryl-sulfate sulfotransferase [Aureliella sp.]
MRAIRTVQLYSFYVAAFVCSAFGCSRKPGEPYDGVILFAPFNSTETQLINNNHEVVHSWQSDLPPGQCVYLQPDGSLLRTGRLEALGEVFQKTYSKGSGGRVDWLEWDGTLRWSFALNTEEELLHHDIEPMPNGNLLMLVWVHIPHATAVAAGCRTSTVDAPLLSERIIEVDPATNSIVWQWDAWDHIYQTNSPRMPGYSQIADPRRLDVNLQRDPHDWLHFNSLSYHKGRDLIAISCRQTSEIYLLDHSTTLAEAKTRSGGDRRVGGDIYARWGNSSDTSRRLFHQHHANWIPEGCPGAGNLILFNNGKAKERVFSEVLEVSFDEVSVDFRVVWAYQTNPKGNLYSQYVSSAQRLPNGNTLICSGCQGMAIEIDMYSNESWRFEYFAPTRKEWVFRIEKWPIKAINSKSSTRDH